MKDETLNKIYNISNIIIAILFFIFALFFRLTSDMIGRIFFGIIFVIATLLFRKPCTKISKNLIEIGDKLNNILLKILYYFVLLPIVVVILNILIFMFFSNMASSAPESSGWGSELLIFFVGIFVSFIFVVISYFQTLIVILIRLFIKKEKD